MIELIIGKRYKVLNTECILTGVQDNIQYFFQDDGGPESVIQGYECIVRTDDDFRKVVDSKELREIE